MATRSIIAVEISKTQYVSVYCHWDGYLENNGKILFTHYSDLEKAKALVEKGNMSSLKNNVDTTEFYYPREAPVILNHQDRLHTEEWTYLFRNGNWYYRKNSGRGGMDRFRKITERVFRNLNT